MHVITTTDTVLTTDTVHTSLGRGSTLVRRLPRHDIGLVRLERQRLAVRRTAAGVALELGRRWRLAVRRYVHALRALLQGRDQRLRGRVRADLAACLRQQRQRALLRVQL